METIRVYIGRGSDLSRVDVKIKLSGVLRASYFLQNLKTYIYLYKRRPFMDYEVLQYPKKNETRN
jgi:hypothetical protein